MDGWPSDSRAFDATPLVPKRQGPRKVRPEPYWNAPLLDNGTLGSFRLLAGSQGGSRNLEWDNIVQVAERLSTGNARCIFPPTREEPKGSLGASLEQKALRTNAWLRTSKGIQDIENHFLRDMLEEDEKYRRDVLTYEPYMSNLLATSSILKGHKKRAGILAYPMGQYFNYLGASILFDERWGTVVVPCEQPIWKTSSSILQITSSKSLYKPFSDYRDAGCLFAVRTLFDISFISIIPTPSAKDPAKANIVGSVTSTAIGGRRPFHVAMNPDQSPDCLIVSDVGTVWSVGLGSPAQALFPSVEEDSARIGAYDLPYWEVAWGSHPETLLLGSRSSLSLYDRRASRVASTFEVHSGSLASFDILRRENRVEVFLCDRERVTLLDERMFTTPLVSWKHRREHDRTLRITALAIENKHVGLLSSRRSHFVSVYDPFRNENSGLTKCDSYSLEFKVGTKAPLTSIASYIPPASARSGALGSLFRLTETGAIYRQDLAIGAPKPTGEEEIWAHELQRLASRVPLERESCDEADLVKNTEISLRREYTFIFGNESLDHYLIPRPSVVDIVDLAPSALQRSNEPVEKIMTLHDMIRVVSQESSDANPRALFASTNTLPLPNASSLLKVVTQLRTQTYETVPWSCDLSKIQQRLCQTVAATPSPKELAVFSANQAAFCDKAGPGSSADERAREEIALDLALATTIYSSLPFEPSRPRQPPAPIGRDEDEMLSVAASAMTLEEAEPPHLNHIQPRPTEGLVDGKKGAEQRQSLAVRLLASEWDPDSSVDDYEFFDPYSEEYNESMPAWKLSAQTKADRQAIQHARSVLSAVRTGPGIRSFDKPPLPSVQISRPRPLGPKTVPAGAKIVPARLAESQPELVIIQTMSGHPREPDDSQMTRQLGSSQIPSTQVLVGPFGGRPGAAPTRKKKPRLAGF